MTTEVFSPPVVARCLKRPKSEPRKLVKLEQHQPKRRTMTDFNTFCTWVLDYEASLQQGEMVSHFQQGEMEFVKKRSASPLDSEGNSFLSGESDASTKSFSHLELEKGEDWESITCFCSKPFSGRPMIECNECNTWIHLSCAKIRKSNVPEVFVCAQCKDSKQDIRRSHRQREPKKQFKELYEEL